MKATHFLLCCALFVVGCSKPAEPPLKNQEFQGQQQLTPRVENLRGTALLGIDQTDLPDSVRGGNVSFFVMLDSAKPDTGILVKAPMSEEELAKQESARLNVTGNVTNLDAPGLADKLKQKYGFNPKTSSDGKVQMIVHEGPLVLPAASESPTASESPAAPSDESEGTLKSDEGGGGGSAPTLRQNPKGVPATGATPAHLASPDSGD